MRAAGRWRRSTVLGAAVVVAAAWAAPAAAEPAAPPTPKTSIDADGTYSVGTDIVAGTYRSAGPAGDGTCYWKRLRGDAIVDNAMSKKPQTVQVDATDTAFRSNGCQPWQLVDCAPGCLAPERSPGDLLRDVAGFLGPRALAPPPTG
ncbi:hypothetical protein LV457_17210 [Mycobacterium sp. MYCO198283]|uniref:hypothetical protein n=1 Tax=Mycobacterium sp. MYCO198283 TaxID=2883505 RepID=UPI001E291198|nr:hypothetical protein [Mycobacterium sp. MYCO198283]MCG5434013.1 hypothetical protein [Mycobacterium sp. MYCO198283]